MAEQRTESVRFCERQEMCEMREQIQKVYGDADRYCAKYGTERDKHQYQEQCATFSLFKNFDFAVGRIMELA